MRAHALGWLLLGFGTLAAPTTSASADEVVTFSVNRRAKAFGTILLPSDTHAWVVDGPRGARVKARARRTGKGAIVPGVDVLDEDLNVVVEGTAAARGQRVSGETGESGDHRVRVGSPDGVDGDYVLTITVRPRKTWVEREGDDLDGAAEGSFGFAAPSGTTARFELRPRRRSSFAPELIEVTGPDEFVHAFDGDTATARRHVARDVLLGGSGEYEVRFRNAGDEPGSWQVVVRLRLPAQTRTIEDLRLPEGETESLTVVGEPLLPGETVGGDPESELGATELAPGDGEAPPVGTSASLREGEDLEPDDLNTAGDPVEVTIQGGFDGELEYTGVYDPQAYDGDADEESNVEFLICYEESGESELIENEDVDVDAAANTGTFQISGAAGKRTPPPKRVFTVQAVSPRDRPLRGTFMELEARGRADAEHGGQVTFGLNTLHGLAGLRTGNGFTRDFARRTLTWSLARRSAQLGFSQDDSRRAGTVEVSSNDEVVLVAPGTRTTLARGRASNVLLRRRLGKDVVTLGANLRRAKGTPTPLQLAGSYRAMVWEVSGTRNPDNTVRLASVGQTAQLTVDVGGTVTATFPQRQRATTVFPGDGTWTVKHDTRRVGQGKMEPFGDDARLGMRLGDIPDLDQVVLAPVLRGAALVGVASRVEGRGEDPERVILRLVVLVRHDDDASTANLDGRSVAGTLTLDALDRKTAPADAAFSLSRLNLQHDGVGGVGITGTRNGVEHDANGDVLRVGVPVDRAAPYSIKRNGTYLEWKPATPGALTRRGQLLVTTSFVNGVFQLRFATPARPE